MKGNVIVKTPPGFTKTEESIESRLRSIVNWAGKESGASYAFLLLPGQKASGLDNITWYGQEQKTKDCTAVAQWVLSRAKPLILHEQADGRELLGLSLGKELLPIICVPVIRVNNPVGVLAAGSPYSAREKFQYWLPFLESLGELTGALLEVRDLRQRLSYKKEQVQYLIKSTLEAQEVERECIGLDIHDGVTQTLTGAFLYLQTLQAVLPEDNHIRQLFLKTYGLVKQAIQELREVINGLQPATLKEFGLAATLGQEIRELEQELGWKIDFEADVPRLHGDIEIGLYRIIHEAITNVKKHANTQRLRIRLNSADDKVKAEVRDWGVGFICNSPDVIGRHNSGLLSMHKRAELLQGTCEIRSIPGLGTAVLAEIPISL